MTRFPRYALLLAVVALVAIAVSPGLAQVAVKEAGQGGQPVKPFEPQYLYVPGYWQLSQPNVQKEIELLPEQIEKLKALGKKYYDEQREDYKAYGDWSKLTPEERTAKYKEMMEKSKKRNAEVRAEAEKILLPHQIQALQDINLRSYGQYMLMQPNVMQAVGLTEEQKTKLQGIRTEYTEKQAQLNKEMLDKQFQLLTPEQRAKLKEQMQKQWQGY